MNAPRDQVARMTRGFCLLASLITILAAGGGCEQDHPVLAPPRGGTIRGYVHDGATFAEPFTVVARSVGTGPEITVTDYVELDGRFALNVPNGKYVVYFRPEGSGTIYYHDGGPVLREADADTVHVAGDEHDLAVACGRVTFDLDLPAAVDGAYLYCSAIPIGETWLSREIGASVTDGLRVELRFVPTGAYRLAFGGGGFVDIYFPPTLDRDAAEVVDVLAGQELVWTVSIDALATISGSVTGSWQTFGHGRPEVEARVGDSSVARVDVADDGSYAFQFLAGGPVRLRVRIDDVNRWIGGNDAETATVFALETGGAIAGISYVESGLDCRLTGETDIWGAFAELYDDQGRSLGWTRSSGDTLRVSNLPPGNVYLHLRPRTSLALWLEQYYDRRDSLAVADPIAIPPDGQIADAVAVLVRGGRIRGRILDVIGLPPRWYDLAMNLHAPGDSLAAIRGCYFYPDTYDEVTGDYVINQVPDGDYKLRARVKDVWTWWPHHASFAGGGTVTIENHAEVTLDDWQLIH